MGKKITSQALELIKKSREQEMSFVSISEKLKEELDVLLSPELIRYYANKQSSPATAVGEVGAPEVVQDPSTLKLSKFLEERNITVKDLEKMFYNKEIETHNDYEIHQPEGTIKIGVVSDTHLGAKTCALKELHDFYNLCKKEGVTDILNAGDVCDGNGKVYKGQMSELVVYGLDDNVQYIKDNYPKVEGITTHFITGNHDESFLQSDGADIGKAIANVREDMHYLGFYNATVVINGIKIGLHHGAGGGSYAQSYKLQKYVETLTGDNKPQLYILGHYHGSLYMSVRNIHCLLPGCWQKVNNFSVRLGLPNIIGGYIIEIDKTAQNEIRAIRPKFIQYYF